jgi:hypothetical protein
MMEIKIPLVISFGLDANQCLIAVNVCFSYFLFLPFNSPRAEGLFFFEKHYYTKITNCLIFTNITLAK